MNTLLKNYKNFSSGEKILITISSFNYLIAALSGVFFQIYVFQIGGYKSLFTYYFYGITFIVIGYILSGYIFNKYPTKLLICLGFILDAVGWGLILFLKEGSINYILLLGLVFGLGSGFYWSGFNLSQFLLTYQKDRNIFFGTINFFTNLISCFSPAIAGIIIFFGKNIFSYTLAGYYLLFSIVFILMTITILISFLLPSHKGIVFKFSDLVSEKTSIKWRLVLTQQIFMGLMDTSLGVLSAIILYLALKTELYIGITNSLYLLVLGLFSYYAGSVISKKKNLYQYGTLGMALGIFCLGFFNNIIGIIIFIIIVGISAPFVQVPFSSLIFDTIDESQIKWERKFFFLIQRDIVLGVARLISFLILLLMFSWFDKNQISRYWLMIISICPLIIGLLFKKIYQINK